MEKTTPTRNRSELLPAQTAQVLGVAAVGNPYHPDATRDTGVAAAADSHLVNSANPQVQRKGGLGPDNFIG